MQMRGRKAQAGLLVGLAVLLAAVLAVAGCVLAPPRALAAGGGQTLDLYAHWANSDVRYIDAEGAEKDLEGKDYTMLSEALSESLTLSGGLDAQHPRWYVVDAVGFDTSERIVIVGHVNLVLRNGKTLDASGGGIEVPEGSSLAIFQQPVGKGEQAGALAAKAAPDEAAPNPGAAGIGGGAGAACGSVTINGGTVEAEGVNGGAGIGGGSGGSGGAVAINGGRVTATGGGSGPGIGAGGGASEEALAATSVTFDWSRRLFSETEVTAASPSGKQYSGSVGFTRPYVLKAGDEPKDPARYDGGTGEVAGGGTIAPGICLDVDVDVPLREGRWYDRFKGGAKALEIPANSSFTALVDLAAVKAKADNVFCDVTGLGLEFGSPLPEGTALTLTAIRQDGDGGAEDYEHYSYTVGEGGESEVRLTSFRLQPSSFKSMEDRATQPALDLDGAGPDDDEAYLVSVDFAAASAGATSSPVSVDVLADYALPAGKGWSAARDGECVVSRGADSFQLVALGELEVGASTVKVAAQPSGSELLEGKRVYLVGVVSKGDDSVSLQDATATCSDGTQSFGGTWIAPDVVEFELGDYGDIGGLVEKTMKFSVAATGEGIGSGYEVAWTLCTGSVAPGDPASWNVRRDAVSNTTAACGFEVARAETEALPSLSVTSVSPSSRLLPAGGPRELAFTVSANRAYTVTVEKQAALHDFAAVKDAKATASFDGEGRWTASVPGELAGGAGFSFDGEGRWHVTVPGDPGVYRVRFSFDDPTVAGSSPADDVYHAVVVEGE